MAEKLQIPFIQNPSWECGQACSAMMIKYFYPDYEPNFAELDKLIHHRLEKKYTFPLENALLLDDFKVSTQCFSSDDYKTTKDEPNIFKKWFGKDYDVEKNYINENEYDWMVSEGLKRKLFVKRKTSFDDFLEYFHKGYLVTFAVDWNTLVGKEAPYQGHFMLLSGIHDTENLLIHNPDEGPFVAYSRRALEAAYNHPVIADDCWVAFGRK